MRSSTRPALRGREAPQGIRGPVSTLRSPAGGPSPTLRAICRQATRSPIRTRSNLLVRALRGVWAGLHNSALHLRIALVSYVIWSDERYLRTEVPELVAGDPFEGESLRAFRAQIERRRVQKALLQGRLL